MISTLTDESDDVNVKRTQLSASKFVWQKVLVSSSMALVAG